MLTYTIRKEFHFSASHMLNNLPPEHPCSRLHGHNYKITVELQSTGLDGAGFVRDYNDLRPLKEYIDAVLDHRHLNNILDQPSAENIAEMLLHWCWSRWPETTAVIVQETDKTWAEVRISG